MNVAPPFQLTPSAVRLSRILNLASSLVNKEAIVWAVSLADLVSFWKSLHHWFIFLPVTSILGAITNTMILISSISSPIFVASFSVAMTTRRFRM